MSDQREKATRQEEVENGLSPFAGAALGCVHIGYGNYIALDKIVAIVISNSLPILKLVKAQGAQGLVVDATLGHRRRSAIVMASGHLILSALSPEAIARRSVHARRDTGKAMPSRSMWEAHRREHVRVMAYLRERLKRKLAEVKEARQAPGGEGRKLGSRPRMEKGYLPYEAHEAA